MNNKDTDIANGHISPGKVSVSDIIHQCNSAVERMSPNNPHKLLLFNCAFALRQLVDRLEKYESARPN